MYAVSEVVERDEHGRFKDSPESLHPKTIGLRLRKSHRDRFLAKADELGLRPTELAREIIEAWIDAEADQ